MRKMAVRFGLSGSMLGILAGLVELCIGERIKPWIGNKDSPAILGLTTMILSGLALAAVLSARKDGEPNVNGKLARFLGVLLPATICFTTVGRLWYLPGPLLIVSSLLFASDYWIKPSCKVSTTNIAGMGRASTVLGLAGSAGILAAVGLGFLKNGLALFHYAPPSRSDQLFIEILPMDVVRRIPLSAGATAILDIEVTVVMLVYVLLILGTALTFFAGLGGSRAIMGIGGCVALAGLILFLAGLPGILNKALLPSLPPGALPGALGWGFHISAIGTGLTIVSSLLGFKMHYSNRTSKDSRRSAGKAI